MCSDIQQVSCAVFLLLHGVEDLLVPCEHSVLLANMARGCRKRVRVFERMGHDNVYARAFLPDLFADIEVPHHRLMAHTSSTVNSALRDSACIVCCVCFVSLCTSSQCPKRPVSCALLYHPLVSQTVCIVCFVISLASQTFVSCLCCRKCLRSRRVCIINSKFRLTHLRDLFGAFAHGTEAAPRGYQLPRLN